MHVMIVESDTHHRLLDELKGVGIDVQEVARTDLIKGEIGVLDSGIMFVDVSRVPPVGRKPVERRSYRSLLKQKY